MAGFLKIAGKQGLTGLVNLQTLAVKALLTPGHQVNRMLGAQLHRPSLRRQRALASLGVCSFAGLARAVTVLYTKKKE